MSGEAQAAAWTRPGSPPNLLWLRYSRGGGVRGVPTAHDCGLQRRFAVNETSLPESTVSPHQPGPQPAMTGDYHLFLPLGWGGPEPLFELRTLTVPVCSLVGGASHAPEVKKRIYILV